MSFLYPNALPPTDGPGAVWHWYHSPRGDEGPPPPQDHTSHPSHPHRLPPEGPTALWHGRGGTRALLPVVWTGLLVSWIFSVGVLYMYFPSTVNFMHRDKLFDMYFVILGDYFLYSLTYGVQGLYIYFFFFFYFFIFLFFWGGVNRGTNT